MVDGRGVKVQERAIESIREPGVDEISRRNNRNQKTNYKRAPVHLLHNPEPEEAVWKIVDDVVPALQLLDPGVWLLVARSCHVVPVQDDRVSPMTRPKRIRDPILR